MNLSSFIYEQINAIWREREGALRRRTYGASTA